MKTRSMSNAAIILPVVIIMSLFASVLLSLQSFTGYIVSEEVSASANTTALVLFLIGIFGSFAYLRYYRH